MDSRLLWILCWQALSLCVLILFILLYPFTLPFLLANPPRRDVLAWRTLYVIAVIPWLTGAYALREVLL